MTHKAQSNVFLGSATGCVKGLKINVKKGEWSSLEKNLKMLDLGLGRKQEVTAMVWGDKEENKIIIGHADQSVKIYDTEYMCFETLKANIGRGKICGVSRDNETLIMAVQSGHVRVCAQEGKEHVLETDGPIEKMKHSSVSSNVIAIGGKNNDLQLWNLEAQKATFVAKNVRKDELGQKVPVWVSDIDFISGSNRVAYCSRYGHVRVYDPQQQRRPVFNLKLSGKVLTACSVTPDGTSIVVGAGDGYMGALDLRGKRLMPHCFKGSVGSICAVAVHPTLPYVFSAGLDKHLKMHDLRTTRLLHKEYMKAQLNCVLPRRDFFDNVPSEDSDIEVIEESESEKSEDEERTEKGKCNKLLNDEETIINMSARKRQKYQRDISPELRVLEK